MICLHMLNNHTVFEQFLAALMTIDNDNNLENINEIISEKVEGDNNIMQQKQDGQRRGVNKSFKTGR